MDRSIDVGMGNVVISGDLVISGDVGMVNPSLNLL